jgi:hypothetical protein
LIFRSKSQSPAALPAAENLYSDLISGARALFRAAAAASPGPWPLPEPALRDLLSLLAGGDAAILALADRSTPDTYLIGHAVNNAILNARVGQALRLPDNDLWTLALSGFLHDLGMAKLTGITSGAGPLSEADKAALRRHPVDSQELLERVGGLAADAARAVREVVGQVHERFDGSGYPEGRAGDAIHPMARILGLCDAYEAMTHERPWRPRLLPHEALRVLVEKNEAQFDPSAVQALVEALSLYPPGSWVRLNTGALGRVVGTRAAAPTRPTVQLVADAEGRRLTDSSVVDLAVQPVLYVADVVDETRLPVADPRLALELRARRWWIRGL